MMQMTRTDWIDAFVTYVLSHEPGASASLLAVAADGLYTRLGEYAPSEVAEAEWCVLPLGDL